MRLTTKLNDLGLSGINQAGLVITAMKILKDTLSMVVA
jgi:hypothetical protein